MMKTKSVFRTLVLLFLIAVMCFPVSILAADNTGSISFKAQTTGDHKVVVEAEFELYKVADYDVTSITLASGFSGLDLSLIDLQDNLGGCVTKVENWMAGHSVTPVASVVSGTDGLVNFNNLGDGIYLVKYKNDPVVNEKYNRVVTAESVLLAIPYVSGSEFVRNVNITPKITVKPLKAPISISVTKKWDDNNSSSRPKEVEVALYKDGTSISTVKLSANNNWTYVWKDLDGRSKYEVKETTIPSGYVATVTKNGEYDFIITNKSSDTPPGPPSTPIKVTVTKTWVMSNIPTQSTSTTQPTQQSQNNGRPSSVQVQLYNGNAVVGAPVTLSDANNWTYTWDKLDSNGNYTVKEVNVPEGFEAKVEKTGSGDLTFRITNTQIVPVDVTVKKVWVGDVAPKDTTTGQTTTTEQPVAQDVRPASIQVQLYNGSQPSGAPVTLSEANQWTYTWQNLAGNGDWSVKEVNVPAGYKVDVTKAQSGQTITFTVTNTKVQPIDLRVNKVWDDADNKERPLSVTIALYNGDQQVGEPVTLSDGNNWTYEWKGLDGTGNWTVKELNVPKDYKVSYTTKDNTIIVTNKFEPNTWTDVVTGDDFAWLRYSVLAFVLVGLGVGGFIFVKKRRSSQSEE